MPILPSSKARAVGAGAQLYPQTPSAVDIPHNVVIVGTFNPGLGGVQAQTIYGPYTSAAAIGIVFGQGYMIHRLAVGLFAGMPSGGATVWVIPQSEVTGAAATSSTFAVSSPATGAGTLAVYVDAIRYAVSVGATDTAITIAGNIAAALTADPNCPVTATSGGTANVTCTAKSKGPWGNSIPVALNIMPGDIMPAGVAITVTALSAGTGVPVIANALNVLGTGTNSNNLPNSQWMTELVHGYLASGTTMTATAQDQITTSAISAYAGPANIAGGAPTGCWDHLVGKPFICVHGDNTNSATVPSALLSYATTNNLDITDGLVSVPGSYTHPCENAACASGVIASICAGAAAKPFIDQLLPGVNPGPSGMWNGVYANRDTAVQGGLSPTVVRGNNVFLQNVVTYFYTNTGVPTTSIAGYGEMSNISVLENIIYSLLSTFRGPKWTGCRIVNDTRKVTNPVDRAFVRSVDDVVDELVNLARQWEANAWIYSAKPCITAIQAGSVVTVGPAGDRFTNVLPAILSGILNIIDTTLMFDTSLAGGGF